MSLPPVSSSGPNTLAAEGPAEVAPSPPLPLEEGRSAFEVAQSLIYSGDLQRATEVANTISDVGDRIFVLQKIYSHYIQQGKLKEAEDFIRTYLIDQPDIQKLILQSLANDYAIRRVFTEARRILNDPRAYMDKELAQRYRAIEALGRNLIINLNKPEEALELAKTQLPSDPKGPHLNSDWGYRGRLISEVASFFIKNGNPGRAVNIAKKELQGSEFQIRVILQLALALYEKGEKEKACSIGKTEFQLA